jgi:hypothetical protein
LNGGAPAPAKGYQKNGHYYDIEQGEGRTHIEQRDNKEGDSNQAKGHATGQICSPGKTQEEDTPECTSQVTRGQNQKAVTTPCEGEATLVPKKDQLLNAPTGEQCRKTMADFVEEDDKKLDRQKEWQVPE